MGWKIPEIKIRVPEVRVPKVKSGRVMPKPRAVKPASGKIGGFSLTIFSSNKGPKGITHIDVIKALIETNGNRRAAARKSGINSNNINCHLKNIQQMSDAQLQKYADELGVTAEVIKSVCACLKRTKDISHADIIAALLRTNGNRTESAKKLGVSSGSIRYHAQNIRLLSDARLQKYADKFRTSVAQIRRVCAELDMAKGITRIKIIETLLLTNGNRNKSGKILDISSDGVGKHAANIRRLSDVELAEYAAKLKTTAGEIRRVCADLKRTKGITHIDIIGALLETRGNRKEASHILKTDGSDISVHAKYIRRLSDADLQKYAEELSKKYGKKINIADIKEVVALKRVRKIDHQKRLQIIKTLIETDGNRTAASKKLGMDDGNICQHAQNIRHLPDVELAEYAAKLKTTAGEIRRICADLTSVKGVTHIEVVKALIETKGDRTAAAKKLGVTSNTVTKHISNIRRLSDSKLQSCAAKLKTTAGEIRRVCADLTPHKNIKTIDIIKTLILTNGNYTVAAKKLDITATSVTWHAKNITCLPDAELAKYAAELGVTVERIKQVCASRLERAKKLFRK